MAYGAEIYDANGNLILAADGRLFRFHSTYSFNDPLMQNVWTPVTGMEPDGTWAVLSDNTLNSCWIESGGFWNHAWGYSGTTTNIIVVRL